MTAARVEEGSLHGWRALRLVGREVALAVVPDLGGRILSLTHRGEELLFVDDRYRGEVHDLGSVADVRGHKRALGFRLHGGDKTWISPQTAWWEAMPPLDLECARYAAARERGEAAVTMTSPACRETGLRVERRVSLTDEDAVVLLETIENVSPQPLRRGIWNVTQTLRPFDVYLPGPLAGIRAYPEEGESVALRERVLAQVGGWVRVACRGAAHYKYGGRVARGAVVALRPGEGETLAHVRSFAVEPGAEYAHDAAAEVYNSPSHPFLEIGVHAPLKTLAPGERHAQRQRWSFGRLAAGTGPDEAWTALRGSRSGEAA